MVWYGNIIEFEAKTIIPIFISTWIISYFISSENQYNVFIKKELRYKKYLAQTDKYLTLIQVKKSFLTPAATSQL